MDNSNPQIPAPKQTTKQKKQTKTNKKTHVKWKILMTLNMSLSLKSLTNKQGLLTIQNKTNKKPKNWAILYIL